MIGKVIMVISVLAMAVVVASVLVEESEKKFTFMAACTQDHKEYECEAVWRSGNTTIMPVFIGR